MTMGWKLIAYDHLHTPINSNIDVTKRAWTFGHLRMKKMLYQLSYSDITDIIRSTVWSYQLITRSCPIQIDGNRKSFSTVSMTICMASIQMQSLQDYRLHVHWDKALWYIINVTGCCKCLWIGVTGFEPAASCSQSRRATSCATPRYDRATLINWVDRQIIPPTHFFRLGDSATPDRTTNLDKHGGQEPKAFYGYHVCRGPLLN